MKKAFVHLTVLAYGRFLVNLIRLAVFRAQNNLGNTPHDAARAQMRWVQLSVGCANCKEQSLNEYGSGHGVTTQ